MQRKRIGRIRMESGGQALHVEAEIDSKCNLRGEEPASAVTSRIKIGEQDNQHQPPSSGRGQGHMHETR